MLKEFWITNVSKKDVSLRDLAFTLRARTSRNLLDAKHFHYTLEQLEASATNGSLYAKSNMIKIRRVAPVVPVKPGIYVQNEPRMGRGLRSQVTIVEKRLEDLIGDDVGIESDNKFAMDFVEDDDVVNVTAPISFPSLKK